ncbi:MAG: hypothetical protein AAGH15_18535, partial [Myxococcota bacterium]
MREQIARLRAVLRPVPRRDDPRLHRALMARGGSRELVRYLEEHGTDFEGAWFGCPRSSWLVELA